MQFPALKEATKLDPNRRRLFIGAYGFEPRTLGWVNFQEGQGGILNKAIMFRYIHSKGRNRIRDLRKALANIGSPKPIDILHDLLSPHDIENKLSRKLVQNLADIEEIVLDVSSMTKLLILVSLCMLSNFEGTLRIVYSESERYAPTKEEYDKSKENMKIIARFPSYGVGSIVRTKCLSSIRMQGQPVTMVAFTSFNEQLIRHMLGTISPHRLLFINGRPPSDDYEWREYATQEIHKRLIDEYANDNPTNEKGYLARVTSTLKYHESIECIDNIYKQFGTYERIICAATGSKMQTVGLFFCKMMHPDIHIEYPTPDSYYVQGLSSGVKRVYEIVIPEFSAFLKNINPYKQETIRKSLIKV